MHKHTEFCIQLLGFKDSVTPSKVKIPCEAPQRQLAKEETFLLVKCQLVWIKGSRETSWTQPTGPIFTSRGEFCSSLSVAFLRQVRRGQVLWESLGEQAGFRSCQAVSSMEHSGLPWSLMSYSKEVPFFCFFKQNSLCDLVASAKKELVSSYWIVQWENGPRFLGESLGQQVRPPSNATLHFRVWLLGNTFNTWFLNISL